MRKYNVYLVSSFVDHGYRGKELRILTCFALLLVVKGGLPPVEAGPELLMSPVYPCIAVLEKERTCSGVCNVVVGVAAVTELNALLQK
jgi:hypothetical protein